MGLVALAAVLVVVAEAPDEAALLAVFPICVSIAWRSAEMACMKAAAVLRLAAVEPVLQRLPLVADEALVVPAPLVPCVARLGPCHQFA